MPPRYLAIAAYLPPGLSATAFGTETLCSNTPYHSPKYPFYVQIKFGVQSKTKRRAHKKLSRPDENSIPDILGSATGSAIS